MRRRKLMHFTHHHPLRESNVQEGDGIVCSVCEIDLAGPAYKCDEPKCGFLLHKDCLEVAQRKLEHKFHPKHPLTLLSSPAHGASKFNCNACGDAGTMGSGTAFGYHCSVCDYNLHVNCAHIPETLEFGSLHQHPLTLCDSVLYNKEEIKLVCDVCDGIIRDGCWVYCCSHCDFGSHLDCVVAKLTKAAKEKAAEGSGSKDAMAPVNDIIAAQLEAQAQIQLMQAKSARHNRQMQSMRDTSRAFSKIH